MIRHAFDTISTRLYTQSIALSPVRDWSMELFRLLCGSSNHVSISQRTLDHVTDPSYSSTLAFLLSEQILLQLRWKQQSNVYTTTALLRLFRTAIFNGAKTISWAIHWYRKFSVLKTEPSKPGSWNPKMVFLKTWKSALDCRAREQLIDFFDPHAMISTFFY